VAYKIAWTEPASQDLDEILTYVGRNNPSAAMRLGQQITDKVDLLATSPFLGSVYSQSGSSNRRETRQGNYRIFYRLKESEQRVEILAIWHAARQEPNLPLDD
jgi:toxin ParE1/3/4